MNQQVAIITGAASGIGNGIAQRLGSEGCKVIIFDFDSKGGNKALGGFLCISCTYFNSLW